MPKDTFNNLNDEKKERIFHAAVQEFSHRRFSEASINQIVKNARIPKGSFYQYFSGKEDIYLFMAERMSRDISEIRGDWESLYTVADFREIIMQRARDTLKIGRARPEYYKICALIEIDSSPFMIKLMKAAADKDMQIIERDKERGLIKPDIDAELVIQIIHTFIFNEYLYCGFDEARYLQKVEEALQMLLLGIATRQDQ